MLSVKIVELPPKIIKKSNPHYTRGITSKRVTSGDVRFRDLAQGKHKNVAAVTSRWLRCPI